MKSPSAPHRERWDADQRLIQITTVATRLLGERGFWTLSLRDVADECGMSISGVLHHVGSKDGLLTAVMDHRDDADLEALSELFDASKDDVLAGRFDGGIEELCHALMARNAQQPEVVRLHAVISAEALQPGHPAHEYAMQHERLGVQGFQRLLAGRTDTPVAVARQLMSLMDGLQVRWLWAPDEVDLLAEWDSAAAPIFARLRPRDPGLGRFGQSSDET